MSVRCAVTLRTVPPLMGSESSWAGHRGKPRIFIQTMSPASSVACSIATRARLLKVAGRSCQPTQSSQLPRHKRMSGHAQQCLRSSFGSVACGQYVITAHRAILHRSSVCPPREGRGGRDPHKSSSQVRGVLSKDAGVTSIRVRFACALDICRLVHGSHPHTRAAHRKLDLGHHARVASTERTRGDE